jgi:molybdate transport system substrate-binding protein
MHAAVQYCRLFVGLVGRLVVAAWVIWITPGHNAAQAAEVTVFAAASLKPALDPIAADWGAATGNTVTISYGGSSALARQIQSGAPADLFISASTEWMDVLAADDLIMVESRVDLVSNRLVLVANGTDQPSVDLSATTDLHSMLRGGKLSMANILAVPAGQYGKQALDSLGLWSSIAGDVVESENVRAALGLVELGEATMGVVYASDIIDSHGVSQIAVFPETSHEPIRYPAAVLLGARMPEALAFLNALTLDAAQTIFAQKGFVLLYRTGGG